MADTDTQRASPLPDPGAVPGPGAGAHRFNPAALSPEDLARVLGLHPDVVRRHIDEGAPVGSTGLINLVHYAAWLNTPSSAAGGGTVG